MSQCRLQPFPAATEKSAFTGVTRGKKLVVLAGQKKAIAIAVRNVSGRRRWSKLSEWLASKRSDDCATERVEGS